MPFTIPQRQDLEQALIAAFNTPTLAQALRDHFATRLDVITGNTGFSVVVADVLAWAEQNGWERALVRMVHEARPDQPVVIAFLERHREFPALLPPDQRERLRAGLFSAVKTIADLRNLLTPPLGAQPYGFVDGAADDSSAETYLTTLVRWADHFDRVEALIERALERFPENPVLESQARPLLTGINARRPGASQSSAVDPFDACDLDGTLLIDRAPLRAAIRSLSGGGNPRIVGVEGDARSGKTHSKYFIQHIAEKEKKYDTLVVDLSDEAPATFRPDHLIKRIVRQWGRNDLVDAIPPRDPTEAEARWVIDLATFLVGESRKSQRLLVIVLDGFACDKLHPLTRELVCKLVRMASVEKYLRLVLLHYPPDVVANEPPGRVDTHRIALLSERDVRDFVTKYARTHGEEPAEEAVTLIVNGVFRSPAPVNNEEIAQRVNAFVRQVMQP